MLFNNMSVLPVAVICLFLLLCWVCAASSYACTCGSAYVQDGEQLCSSCVSGYQFDADGMTCVGEGLLRVFNCKWLAVLVVV